MWYKCSYFIKYAVYSFFDCFIMFLLSIVEVFESDLNFFGKPRILYKKTKKNARCFLIKKKINVYIFMNTCLCLKQVQTRILQNLYNYLFYLHTISRCLLYRIFIDTFYSIWCVSFNCPCNKTLSEKYYIEHLHNSKLQELFFYYFSKF